MRLPLLRQKVNAHWNSSNENSGGSALGELQAVILQKPCIFQLRGELQTVISLLSPEIRDMEAGQDPVVPDQGEKACFSPNKGLEFP